MNNVDITSTITVGSTNLEQYIFHVTGCPSFAATDVPTTFAEAPIGVALPPISVPIESDHASTESKWLLLPARLVMTGIIVAAKGILSINALAKAEIQMIIAIISIRLPPLIC